MLAILKSTLYGNLSNLEEVMGKRLLRPSDQAPVVPRNCFAKFYQTYFKIRIVLFSVASWPLTR